MIRPNRKLLGYSGFSGLLLWSSAAQAHSFGKTFTLPIPFWIYAWACGATLVLTFLLMALKGDSSASKVTGGSAPFYDALTDSPGLSRSKRWIKLFIQILSLYAFSLAIFSGWYGTQNKTNNFNMTYFWVLWMLGLVYLSGFLGNLYRWFNPFGAVIDLLEWVYRPFRTQTPLIKLSSTYQFTPALLGLMALVTLELFGDCRPRDISILLSGYLVYCVLGCWLMGRKAFFEQADFFYSYFHLLGLCSRSIRKPGNPEGLMKTAPNTVLVFFIVALFATTAFDGLLGTRFWLQTVWPAMAKVIAPLVSDDPQKVLANPLMINYILGPWFLKAEKLLLWLSPAFLFGLFTLAVHISAKLTHWQKGTGLLMREYALCLMPIVLAYSFSHYFTLLLTQGIQTVHLLSDPVGRGWDLLGTRNLWSAPYILDVKVTWNIQIGALLVGHVYSAYLTHEKAFQLLRDKKLANIGQLPLLVLMIGLTVLGLWILSQPARI